MGSVLWVSSSWRWFEVEEGEVTLNWYIKTLVALPWMWTWWLFLGLKVMWEKIIRYFFSKTAHKGSGRLFRWYVYTPKNWRPEKKQWPMEIEPFKNFFFIIKVLKNFQNMIMLKWLYVYTQEARTSYLM